MNKILFLELKPNNSSKNLQVKELLNDKPSLKINTLVHNNSNIDLHQTVKELQSLEKTDRNENEYFNFIDKYIENIENKKNKSDKVIKLKKITIEREKEKILIKKKIKIVIIN